MEKDNRVCQAHSGFEARLDEHERRLGAGSERMNGIESTITEIRDDLLRRPSWTVLALITGLFAVIAGLIGSLVGG